MSTVSPRSRPTGGGGGSDILDGRGGSNKADTANLKAPRHVYYRLYTKYGAIGTMNPIYANNEFIGRTLSRLITPPHTALSIKNHLCKVEDFKAGTSSTLMESFLNMEAMEASTRVLLKGDSGPGLSEDDPMILVFESTWGRNNSTVSLRSEHLSVSYEPRYRLCQHSGGAIATKTSFDTDDKFLGRVDTLSVTPPHTVASLGSRIAYAEGVVQSKVQLFKDTEGDTLMDDDDQLSLLAQTYPGCAEDDPMAVVCEDVPQEVEEFSAAFKL